MIVVSMFGRVFLDCSNFDVMFWCLFMESCNLYSKKLIVVSILKPNNMIHTFMYIVERTACELLNDPCTFHILVC